PRECLETRERQASAASEHACESLGKRELGWIDDARRSAARFVHAISPSKFAPEEEIEPSESADVWLEIEPELRPPRIDSPAMRYGVWWHELAQEVPWSLEPDAWQNVFEESLSASPDPARSRREWILFCDRMSRLSDFPARFSNGETIVHTEMPFFW